MKNLTKKLATFGCSMAAFGVQQIADITLQDEARVPIAAFDNVSSSAVSHCKGSIRQVFELADKLQSEAIETAFWLVSRQSFGGLLGKHGLRQDAQTVRAAIPGFGRVQEAVISVASLGR